MRTATELTVRPFSNGSEYGAWNAANCDRCVLGAAQHDETLVCEIETALTVAYCSDGTVSQEIAGRMGIPASGEWKYGPCPERQPLPDPYAAYPDRLEVPTLLGPRTVAVAHRTAHFAVTGRLEDEDPRLPDWRITHLATGRLLGIADFDAPDVALRVAEACERAAVDWDAVTPTMPKRQVRKLAAVYRALRLEVLV